MGELKREYYFSGQLFSEIFKVNEKKEGEYKSYWEN